MSDTAIPYATPTRQRGFTARDVFGLVVRLLGLLMTLYGLYTLLYLVLIQTASARTGGQSVVTFLIMGAFWSVFGAAWVRGEWIVRFAYGPPPLL